MGVTIDYSQYEDFFNRLRIVATRSFQSDFKKMLEGAATEFLSMVQDAILAHGNVDTRLMLNSYKKGGPENVWVEGGMSYEVGSNVYYCKYVNYGHHTRGGGSWVEGSHFWEEAVRAMEHEFPKYVHAKFAEWLSNLI